MCGIFVYVCKVPPANKDQMTTKLLTYASRLKHRGPDSFTHEWVSPRIFFAFHRLSLVGQAASDNMPIHAKNCTLICNGMIYNYKEFRFPYTTKNDCESIIHLYKKYGADNKDMFTAIRGVYAFALYDAEKDNLLISNDHMGMRPLYQGWTTTGDRAFASEPVALSVLCDDGMRWFSPGKIQEFHGTCVTIDRWWDVWSIGVDNSITEEAAITRVGQLLEDSVKVRLLGDRPLACLLSGGVDSSTVAAMVAKHCPSVHTFSIGMLGSPDLAYARKVAEHIGSTHHEVLVTPDEMLAAVPATIRAIQSFDITTVRASVPQYLLCKYIREHTDFKMIFNGDCSEEIFSSYSYSRFFPSEEAFLRDNRKLVDEVHIYDVLRSDRCIAHFGMDARTPFEDRALVEYVMSLPPSLKTFGSKGTYDIEKYLLRRTAEKLLPAEVAWRPKEAFSDGVSTKEKSWHSMLQAHFASVKPSPIFLASGGYPIKTPEAFSYLQEYAKIFGYGADELLGRKGRLGDILDLVPQYWMPRFVPGMNDPSARELPPA